MLVSSTIILVRIISRSSNGIRGLEFLGRVSVDTCRLELEKDLAFLDVHLPCRVLSSVFVIVALIGRMRDCATELAD